MADYDWGTVGKGAAAGAGTGAVAGPWGAVVGGLVGAGYGMYQVADAKKKRDELMRIDRTRPIYQIPGQVGENTAMYRNAYQNTRIPGQNIAENNIYQGQANQNNAIVGTGRNAGQIMASLVGANQGTTNSLNQLAVRGAEMNNANRDKYGRQMGIAADYSEKEFDMNTFQPYQQRLDEFNRGMAMNRQQQQQAAQTIMNSATILGSAYDMRNRRNKQEQQQEDSMDYGDTVPDLGGSRSFPVSSDPNNSNMQYGNNNGFTPLYNSNYSVQAGIGRPLSYKTSRRPFNSTLINYTDATKNNISYNPYYIR